MAVIALISNIFNGKRSGYCLQPLWQNHRKPVGRGEQVPHLLRRGQAADHSLLVLGHHRLCPRRVHPRLDHQKDGSIRHCRNPQVRNMQGDLLCQAQDRQEKDLLAGLDEKGEGVEGDRTASHSSLPAWHIHCVLPCFSLGLYSLLASLCSQKRRRPSAKPREYPRGPAHNFCLSLLFLERSSGARQETHEAVGRVDGANSGADSEPEADDKAVTWLSEYSCLECLILMGV